VGNTFYLFLPTVIRNESKYTLRRDRDYSEEMGHTIYKGAGYTAAEYNQRQPRFSVRSDTNDLRPSYLYIFLKDKRNKKNKNERKRKRI